MTVTIRQWPSMPTYRTVTLRDGSMGQMGCIDQRVPDGVYYFHAYMSYDRLNAYDKALVDEAVQAEVALLNLTQRMLK